MRSQIQTRLLTRLYEMEWNREGSLQWAEWGEANGYSIDEVDRIYEELSEEGLVQAASLGRYVEITIPGVVQSEKEGLDGGRAQHFDNLRVAILRSLAKAREEHGVRAAIEFREIATEGGFDEHEVYANMEILEYFTLVQHEFTGHYRITPNGLEMLSTVEQKSDWGETWKRLNADSSNPQKRGHDLEKLLADVARSEDWAVKTNSLAPGEENDLIISHGFTTFVLSCKWTSEVTEAQQVQVLMTRVQARPGSFGLIASVSGFSSGATEWVKQSALGLVLLMGRSDLESVFTGKEKLTAMLLRKYQAYMNDRKPEYE